MCPNCGAQWCPWLARAFDEHERYGGGTQEEKDYPDRCPDCGCVALTGGFCNPPTYAGPSDPDDEYWTRPRLRVAFDSERDPEFLF